MRGSTSANFVIAALLGALALSGCESLGLGGDVLPDRKVDYKKEKSLSSSLEVPPDLTKSSIREAMVVPGSVPGEKAVYSEYTAHSRGTGSAIRSSDVLPAVDQISVQRDGDKRWLLIEAPPEDVWPRVVGFWRDNGVLLVQEDPTVGVMETGWLENRADIKSDFVTDTIRGVFPGLYSAATRDQFRVRVEEGPRAGTTELYLAHRGMMQKITDASDTERPVWEIRPTDPGLEAVMLRKIMIYLGAAQPQAETAFAQANEQLPRSQLVKDRGGNAMVLIEGDFGTAWRVTGVGLDRVGFSVEDRDRSRGVYYVRYRDPQRSQPDEGLFSKWAFWRSKKPKEQEYQVRLVEAGEQTQVTVLNEKGERDVSPTATRILTLLHEQIR